MNKSLRIRVHHLISRATVWRLRRQGMTIGRDCLISRRANLDRTNPQGVHIGDHTAISFDVAVLTHDFIKGNSLPVRIGNNCFIGARSVIMPGVTIGDHVIVGVGSVVMTDIPAHSVCTGNPARVVERDIVTSRWGVRNPRTLQREGLVAAEQPAPPSPESPAAPEPRTAPPAARTDGLTGTRTGTTALATYFPGVADPQMPFDALGIDSFTLITLRAQIEEGEGIEISDADWVTVRTPADIARFLPAGGSARAAPTGAAISHRQHTINMPQMAMGGLSESWLFKEIGDVHWSVLTGALGVNSRSIQDQAGDRLYATFTRIRYRSDLPFSEYRENDELRITAGMERFGAGMFFSRIQVASEGAAIGFEVMSSFSKFGQKGDNTSLVKGQPSLPEGFPIPSAGALPAFATEYRDTRAAESGASLFTTDYELIPNHDINGVGLLYFAAYPTIMDICLSRYLAGRGRWSPFERDCFYFANSGPDATLRFDLVGMEEDGDTLAATTTLTRGDGKRMALVRTRMKRAA